MLTVANNSIPIKAREVPPFMRFDKFYRNLTEFIFST